MGTSYLFTQQMQILQFIALCVSPIEGLPHYHLFCSMSEVHLGFPTRATRRTYIADKFRSRIMIQYPTIRVRTSDTPVLLSLISVRLDPVGIESRRISKFYTLKHVLLSMPYDLDLRRIRIFSTPAIASHPLIAIADSILSQYRSTIV